MKLVEYSVPCEAITAVVRDRAGAYAAAGGLHPPLEEQARPADDRARNERLS